MIAGTPVDLDACPKRRCRCGKCMVCGWQKHMGIHGGVVGKPGFVFGHEYVGVCCVDISRCPTLIAAYPPFAAGDRQTQESK